MVDVAKIIFHFCAFVCVLNAEKASKFGDDSLNFIVMGDWGGLPDFPFRTPIEKAVAAEMGKIADKIDSKFTLALGDNFYFSGVKDISDKRFQTTFEQVFTAESMYRPWYIVAGNHDHNGNISAQIEYSKLSKRWNFPDLYYKLTFGSPDGAIVDIIMIDTVQLCGNSDTDMLGLKPTGPVSQQKAEDQWQFIEDSLKNSRADYLLVAGHYPVYSIAEHGPTPGLVQRLDPLLHKYRASAYLCGHEHNIQHLQWTSSGTYNQTVDYFISGAACFIDDTLSHKDSVPPGSAKFHWANTLALGSLSTIKMNKQELVYTFLEANGNLLYTQSIKPRQF